MPNLKNQADVKVLAEKFKSMKGMIMTEYHGLSVVQISELRNQLRKSDCEYLVVKNTLSKIALKEVALIVNTPSGQKSHNDGYSIRRTALMYNVPIVTTLAAAHATVEAIKAKRNCNWEVCSIQTHYNVVL